MLDVVADKTVADNKTADDRIADRLAVEAAAVRLTVDRLYASCAGELAAEYRPAADWLNFDLLPTLVLLPGLCCGSEKMDAAMRDLAAAMELSFLGGRIHDLAAAKNPVNGRSILIGDDLYTLGALRLSKAGYDQWLGSVGRILCSRSEAMLNRIGWVGRSFVPEAERVVNLHRESGDAFALAAEIAASRVDMPEAERKAYAEFGFYLGVLQGMVINGHDTSGSEFAAVLRSCRGALVGFSVAGIAENCERLIITKMLSEI